VGHIVRELDIVEKQNIYGYQSEHMRPFLKITVNDPRDMSKVKSRFTSGMMIPGLNKHFQTDAYFESNLNYTLRFMIDHKVSGSNWIKLPAGTYKLKNTKTSTAQIEVETK
jgi:DNA polymerase delta subunit 1